MCSVSDFWGDDRGNNASDTLLSEILRCLLLFVVILLTVNVCGMCSAVARCSTFSTQRFVKCWRITFLCCKFLLLENVNYATLMTDLLVAADFRI